MLKSAKNTLVEGTMDLGLPASTIGCEMVEITGNQQLLVTGNKGIRSYTPEEIAVEMRSFILLIGGTGLTIAGMSGQELLIRGCISEIRFQR